MRAFAHRRIVQPLLDLLRVGATPDALAWSLAIGVTIGINPLLGSTTLLALALAGVFRLNVVASQIGNHVVYPLQWLLFPVFVGLGARLFRTGGLPMGKRELIQKAGHHPWETTRLLWNWEWHALIVWLVVALVAAPLLRVAFLPALRRLHARMHPQSAQQT